MTLVYIERLASVEHHTQSLSREEMNLAEVVEEVAIQAVRGVQMDIRWLKLIKYCQQIVINQGLVRSTASQHL